MTKLARLLLHSPVFKEGRCLASTSSVTDPIQRLFLEKTQEYRKKAASAQGGMVDADAALHAALQDELTRVYNNYGVKKEDQDRVTTKYDDTCPIDDPKVWTEKPYKNSIF